MTVHKLNYAAPTCLAYRLAYDKGKVARKWMETQIDGAMELEACCIRSCVVGLGSSSRRLPRADHKFLASQGYAKVEIKLSSDATYVETENRKLAVIRISTENGQNSVIVAGIVGNELKRVQCLTVSAKKIAITRGVCGDKVREVFGVNFGQG
jgi:hypothetical protein